MHIGYRHFTDVQTRPVYIDDGGNQYVYGDDGRPIIGAWLTRDTLDADPPVFAATLDKG